MSNNTILGTKPFSDYMSVVEAASKIMKINEHCGVCDEQGIKKEIEIEEAVLADKDYKYDGKVVKISKKNFSKVHKDFKNSTKGKERMLINDPKTSGTISVPVQFEEVELDEMKWEAGVVYHQEYKNGDRSYFRADSVQKNKRWKGMSVDAVSYTHLTLPTKLIV